MKIHYSLAQIEAFACVYECGNFTRAALKLKKDRTTVSELVENLELDLGYALFDRATRPLHLTSQGQLLYRQARLFLLEAQAFGQIAASLEQPTDQTLTLSYDVFTPRDPLLLLVRRLREHGIQLNLLCQSRSLAEAALLKREVDIGIYPARNQSISESFKWRAIGTLKMSVYAHRNWFAAQPVSLLTLAARNQLIPYEDMPPGLAQWMQIADRFQVVSERSMLLTLLSEEQGWALLPEHWRPEEQAGVTSIATEMGNAGLTHPLVMLWQPGEQAHSALMTAIEVITAVFEEKHDDFPHQQSR
ncbi:LysR family transcriptional regulator [Paramixta manurensis]|uniref:LysR family transcriptional regulator n=1 Tax=Paramixta manurensis TaxID=2740817 RepID=A0A6M8UGK0_9GAMM|nr:LysR family transcriptional regulator [Erwiniaceae bacterium PD-1]